MTQLDAPDFPEFRVVRRGYDRAQVEEYVQRLREFLIDAERRARTSERTAATAARHPAVRAPMTLHTSDRVVTSRH